MKQYEIATICKCKLVYWP